MPIHLCPAVLEGRSSEDVLASDPTAQIGPVKVNRANSPGLQHDALSRHPAQKGPQCLQHCGPFDGLAGWLQPPVQMRSLAY
jgi:hypothetical protein